MQDKLRKIDRKDIKEQNDTWSHRTVLVVEDDKDLSELIRRKLQKEGLQIECVLNGSDAITWIVEHPDTLLLLDYQLPDMTGLHIIETLKEKKYNIPFILMTAHSDVKLAVKMMKLGARDFLEKEKGFLKLLPTIVRQIIDQLETEEKLITAKEDLRKSEEKFKSVVDNVGVGIALISPEFEILSMNKQMQNWFPEIDVSKKSICYRVYNNPPRDNVCSYCSAVKTLEDGQVHQTITETPTVDGIRNYRIVSSPIKDIDGKITAAIEMVEDITERKQAEATLRESEERFRAVTQSTVEAIISTDSDGKITSWNQGAHTIFGYSEEEVLNKSLILLIPERFREAHTKGIKLFSATGEMNMIGKMVEVKGLRKNGTEFPIELSLSTWKRGEDTFYSCVLRDITERKQAEDKIRQYADIVKNMQVGLHVYHLEDINDDRTLKMVATNPAATQFTGVAMEDVLGKTLDENFPGLRKKGIPQTYAKVIRTGRPIELENVYYGDNGVITGAFSVKAFPLPGTCVGIVFENITERKQSEEALHNAHTETEQLLSSISSILIGVDQNHRITRWNEVAQSTFGIDEAEILGTLFFECGITWDWSLVQTHISECRVKNQSTQLDEIRYTKPDAKEGFLRIAFNPILNESNEHAGYLLLASDITEHKTLESQLAQAQKLESIGQLAAGIAHEINTPIQYVGDNTRFLNEAFCDLNELLAQYNHFFKTAENGTINEETVKVIETAVKEADLDYLIGEIPNAINQSLEGVERVATIVRSMKEFSHPGGEDKTAIDINKAITSTITVSRNEWKYVADIVTNFESSLPLVPCFPGEINQVILNIIINAAHAIAEVFNNGSKEKGTITVNTKNAGKWVEIQISDTGAGIPEEVSLKIFDPFFTTKEIGKGTGQGLAISHNVVVEKHKGSLTYDTEIGKGTTFIIRLPVTMDKV